MTLSLTGCLLLVFAEACATDGAVVDMEPNAAQERRLLAAAVCLADGLQWQRGQPLVVPRSFVLPDNVDAQAGALEGLLVARVLERVGDRRCIIEQNVAWRSLEPPHASEPMCARAVRCERCLQMGAQVAQACQERARLAAAVHDVAAAYLRAPRAASRSPSQLKLGQQLHAQRVEIHQGAQL